MAQQLRAFVVLVEDPGSVPELPQSGSQMFVTPVPGDPMTTFGLCGDQVHMHAHTHTQRERDCLEFA